MNKDASCIIWYALNIYIYCIHSTDLTMFWQRKLTGIENNFSFRKRKQKKIGILAVQCLAFLHLQNGQSNKFAVRKKNENNHNFQQNIMVSNLQLGVFPANSQTISTSILYRKYQSHTCKNMLGLSKRHHSRETSSGGQGETFRLNASSFEPRHATALDEGGGKIHKKNNFLN